MNKLVKYLIVTITILININYVAIGQSLNFGKDNLFSMVEKEKYSPAEDSAKAKKIEEYKINMKIPVGIGLLSGVSLGTIFMLTSEKNEIGEREWGFLNAFVGFTVGFVAGFFMTGAVLEAKAKRKAKEETNKLRNFLPIKAQYIKDRKLNYIKFFQYSYQF